MANVDMSRRRGTYDIQAAITEQYTCASDNSSGSSLVDFSSVALYVPAFQVTIALVFCSVITILVSMVSVHFEVSAVRTATFAIFVGILSVWRPVRIGQARGVDIMFDALRPAVPVYILALIFEQLVHSCGPTYNGSLTVRHWLYHACTGSMAMAGLVQSWSPRAYTDYPFAVVLISLSFIAMCTPPPRAGEGPLCEPPESSVAVERVLRALLFGSVYCALAYACEPTKHSIREITLCAIRATTGSVWILCTHRYALTAAAVQMVLVLWARLHYNAPIPSKYSPVSSDAERLIPKSPISERSVSPAEQECTRHRAIADWNSSDSDNESTCQRRPFVSYAHTPTVLHIQHSHSPQSSGTGSPIGSRIESVDSDGFTNQESRFNENRRRLQNENCRPREYCVPQLLAAATGLRKADTSALERTRPGLREAQHSTCTAVQPSREMMASIAASIV